MKILWFLFFLVAEKDTFFFERWLKRILTLYFLSHLVRLARIYLMVDEAEIYILLHAAEYL